VDTLFGDKNCRSNSVDAKAISGHGIQFNILLLALPSDWLHLSSGNIVRRRKTITIKLF
jgi:hypothetical protein